MKTRLLQIIKNEPLTSEELVTMISIFGEGITALVNERLGSNSANPAVIDSLKKFNESLREINTYIEVIEERGNE